MLSSTQNSVLLLLPLLLVNAKMTTRIPLRDVYTHTAAYTDMEGGTTCGADLFRVALLFPTDQ